jgi:hypothetical protein
VIIRALDSSGDWTFGQGRQNYLRNADAVALNIATRLRSFLNDCFWATDFGVDWWNLLGTKNPVAQQNIILQTRAMIADSFGVVRINSVVAETDRSTRRLTIRYNVDTIFTRNLTGDVQPSP